jgi:NAD(P)-dependent dehydrogenase (short-subunit alcohol dehydrogenase family)
MSQTILITGASTGIGKSTAELFANKGWNVIATMRTPENGAELAARDNVIVERLDVTDSASIEAAVAAGVAKFGQIDVLLNNAGYGAYGPLEAFPMENIRRQFDTNVIGLIETTKALLPHMRGNGSGTIVNVSSIGGQMTFPLGALYHGTKFAVEGISEAMSYELAAAGIKVKIIQPGGVKTDFGGRSFDFTNDDSMAEYQPVVQALFKSFEGAMTASEPEVVAECIWTSVTDGTDQLRYHATPDAVALLTARKEQDDATFIGGMNERLGLAKS